MKEARPCFPERTAPEWQPYFRRLAEDQEFRDKNSFRGQVLYAKVFVEDEADNDKEVPNTELAKFFDVLHDQSISAILVAGDTGRSTWGGTRPFPTKTTRPSSDGSRSLFGIKTP